MRIEYYSSKIHSYLLNDWEVSTTDAGSSARIYFQKPGGSGLEQKLNPSLGVIKSIYPSVHEVQAYSPENEVEHRMLMYWGAWGAQSLSICLRLRS